jgi:hypothetical protein
LGLVQKTLEEQYGQYSSDVRLALEDALYYMDRVIIRDEPNQLFMYYALEDYDAYSLPSSLPDISADDPMFACDCYYPDDPWADCGPQYVGYHYYRIDESGGEFLPPPAYPFLADVHYGTTVWFMLDNACTQDPWRSDFRGCLDLDRDYARDRDFWNVIFQAWTFGYDHDAEDFLVANRPDDDGLWTSVHQIDGQGRAVADTTTFVGHLFGMCRYLMAISVALADRDSDGLTDAREAALATDPRYPDTDQDGVSDGDEVDRDGTDPTDSDTDGDGFGDGLEIASGSDPTDPQSHP